MFDRQNIPDGLYDPDARFMNYWDSFQFIALTYMIFVIPIRVGFAVEVPLLSLPFGIDMLIDVYFLVDIYLNFNTAIWLPNGTMEVRFRNRFLDRFSTSSGPF